MKTMKAIVLIVALLLTVGAASADCGVKDTHEGTLKSADAEKKVVVVVGEDGEEVELALTEKTQVKDAEGNKAKVATLVGKKVKVVSEHAKIDSIQQVA